MPRNAAASGAIWQLIAEVGETAKIAFPIVAIQLGQAAMTMTDMLLIGGISIDALAAVAVAGRVYLTTFAIALGVLAPIAPVVAQACAAGKLESIRGALRTGLLLALALSLPLIALATHAEQVLLRLGQAPDVARLSQQYLSGLCWGAVPALSFQAIRNVMDAAHRPQPSLWITLAAIPTNALLVYLLIHGRIGFACQPLLGAGLATAVINWTMFLAGVWFITSCRPIRAYRLALHWWLIDWMLMWRLIAVGAPISLTSALTYGAYSVAGLLAGAIGSNAAAAHQISLQVASIAALMSFGISMATAVRVAEAVGRHDGHGMRRASLAAMLLAIVCSATLAVCVVATRFKIAHYFLHSGAPEIDLAINLAADLLLVSVCGLIPTAVHNVAAGSLRGLQDTRMIPLYAGIAYWLIGVIISYVLGLKLRLGVIGIWTGLLIGTVIYAILLVSRAQVLVCRMFRECDD
nr:probable multidrug resistance protein norM [Bradyrhizobium sp. DOA9]